ncbi:MAG: molybdopterin-dependent oxidoreductase [Dehalococcoidia bacterium]|nr:molybdopterin-dependent oxidoreductase [Dehalococcoidia bacterium]
MRAAEKAPEKEDVWIPSACSICYCQCSIRVHRVDGVVVKIEGNPDSPIGEGRLCSKGASGIMTLYDPNRVNTPLMRTNPEKGIGVDPGWKEISWEEALQTVAERLKKVREKDPRLLFFQGTTTCSSSQVTGMWSFIAPFGSQNFWSSGGGLHCGNGAHLINGIMHASWSAVPDFEYCNYALYFGASKGHSAGHVATQNAQKAADARSRGMKLVVVDPMCNFASGKANEWVPIRVGTDAALALAMVNVLLNEMGVWDAAYLSRHTNAPYLVAPDGHYLRDGATGKPLVWDSGDGEAKPYDDPGPNDAALECPPTVGGVECHTGFQLLKEHVKQFTPDWASSITTIPARTIRRLAHEFGQEARIGSTIVIDGVSLPYRPACAIYFRGAQSHKNSVYNCFSIELLNQIVGAADVPGGALGFNPVSHGHPETGKPHYVPREGPDGLMITGMWMGAHLPYPPHEPRAPETMKLGELFPMARNSPLMVSQDQDAVWRQFGLPYPPEAMINYGANSIMSVGNAATVAEALKKIKFIVSVDVILNEFTDFADIVFPDTCYLERLEPWPNQGIFNHPAGLGEWAWPIRQPAVEPAPQRRSFNEIMLELGERVGIRDGMNIYFNLLFALKPPYQLDPDLRYSWEDICDRVLKNNFGPERDLEWFRTNGLVKWPKKMEEVYWRPFVKVRVPVYWEFLKTMGEQTAEVAKGFGFPIDLARYEPLPSWNPCPSHELRDERYDLFGFYYRDVLHANSFTMENPWLDEAATMNPYSYSITINTDTAQKKGIHDGDLIYVESARGRRIQGKVKLSQGIHPEGLAVAACAGHWSKNQPIARGKGVFFNDLLELDLDHADPVNMNLDVCVKVRVYPAPR